MATIGKLRFMKYFRMLALILLSKISRLIVNDRFYISIMYFIKIGKILHLNPPKTFNEKLQWLKLYNKQESYSQMVDKADVKEFVAKKIGQKYIIPTIGVWKSFEDIDFSTLPDQFVLKCTHDSGGLVVCKNKQELKMNEVKRKINKCMKRNYYWYSREYPYKTINPRIIVEKYMVDESGCELKDYKFFCFNGVVKYVEVDWGRFVKHQRNIYDLDWNLQPFEMSYPKNEEYQIPKPKNLEEMLRIASDLSQGIPFLRVDLYSINTNIYFGELTFFHDAGIIPFSSEEWNLHLGNLLQLPGKL